MGTLTTDPSLQERARQSIIDEYEHAIRDAKRRIAIIDWQFRRHLIDGERMEWMSMDEEARENKMSMRRLARKPVMEGKQQLPKQVAISLFLFSKLSRENTIMISRSETETTRLSVWNLETLSWKKRFVSFLADSLL